MNRKGSKIGKALLIVAGVLGVLWFLKKYIVLLIVGLLALKLW